jgi:hypothetical protein
VLHFLSVISCNKTGVLQWLAGVLSALLQPQKREQRRLQRRFFFFLSVVVVLLVAIIALRKKIENDFTILSAGKEGDRRCWGVMYLKLQKKTMYLYCLAVLHQNRSRRKRF